MHLFFFGYLYFYIPINPIRSSDLDISSSKILKEYDYKNCTICDDEPGQPCFCSDCNENKCSICCTTTQCCYCHNDTLCWNNDWQLITIAHVSISIMFILGIITVIILYLKLCTRRRRIVRARCGLVEDDVTIHCSTIEGLRERPPPYSQTYDAPPLYTSPYNIASMQEAPPVYPGTPKLDERSQCANDISTYI